MSLKEQVVQKTRCIFHARWHLFVRANSQFAYLCLDAQAAAQAAAAHDRDVRGSFAVPASRAPSLEETLTATHHSMLASGFMSVNPSVHPSESPSIARRWGNMSAGEPSFSALYKQGEDAAGSTGPSPDADECRRFLKTVHCAC